MPFFKSFFSIERSDSLGPSSSDSITKAWPAMETRPVTASPLHAIPTCVVYSRVGSSLTYSGNITSVHLLVADIFVLLL